MLDVGCWMLDVRSAMLDAGELRMVLSVRVPPVLVPLSPFSRAFASRAESEMEPPWRVSVFPESSATQGHEILMQISIHLACLVPWWLKLSVVVQSEMPATRRARLGR